MKKVMLFLAVVMMVLAPVFAAQEMSVTWEWLLDDPDVNFYRYQLGSTEENGWTVVAGDVSSYTADGLDPYSDYTLYLQRSYDGVNWSATAESTAEALLVEETPDMDITPVAAEPVVDETPAVEEPAVIEDVEVLGAEEPAVVEDVEVLGVEEPAVVEEEIEVLAVEEPAVVEEEVVEVEEPAALEAVVVAPVAPVEESKESRFAFSLLFKGGFVNALDFDAIDNISFSPIAIADIAFDFSNIVSFNDNVGLGLRLDLLSGTVLPKSGWGSVLDKDEFFRLSNYAYAYSPAAYFTLDARAGIANFNFGLGFTGSFLYDGASRAESFGYNDSFTLLDTSFDYRLAPSALLGVRFYMGDVFSLGVEATYSATVNDWLHHDVSAGVVMGFTF